MNVYKISHTVPVIQPSNEKPVHDEKKNANDPLLSLVTSRITPTNQPLNLKQSSLKTKQTMSEIHQSRRPSASLPTSEHTRSLTNRRHRRLKISSTHNNIQYSRLLLIAFVAIISVSALAALGIGIYDLIRGIQIPTTITTTITLSSATISTTFGLRWQAAGTTVAGLGTAGVGLDRFSTPYSIAIDSFDALYVADYYNNRIQKFASSSSIATTVAGQTGGAIGSTAYDLYHPTSVIVDSNGNIYVSDSGNHRVQYFSNGSFLGITVAGTGSIGSLINELSSPRGLARNSVTSNLYIVDNGNHRVMSYLSGIPTIVAGGNGPGLLNTQLNSPTGLAFDLSSNSLYIANTGSHNIVRWIVNGSSWTLVSGSSIGAVGSTSTTLYTPFSVTLDSFGNIYVVGYSNARIQLFKPGKMNGTTIVVVTSTPDSISNLFYAPYSVTFDSKFNLYVADAGNQRIQKYLRY